MEDTSAHNPYSSLQLQSPWGEPGNEALPSPAWTDAPQPRTPDKAFSETPVLPDLGDMSLGPSHLSLNMQ